MKKKVGKQFENFFEFFLETKFGKNKFGRKKIRKNIIPTNEFRNSVKTFVTRGPQQPIQKFSQNVTDAGSSTAYSEIQSKRH